LAKFNPELLAGKKKTRGFFPLLPPPPNMTTRGLGPLKGKGEKKNPNPKKNPPIVVKPPPVPDIKLSNTARLIAAHAIETGGLAFFKMLPAVIGAVPDVIAAREYLEGVYTELNTIE